MTSFLRWLRSLMLTLTFVLPTLGCQVLFGDYKIGTRASGGAGGESGLAENVGSPGGGAGNAQVTGPLIVTPTHDLFTSDLGAQAVFYVSLGQKPSAPVTLSINSTNSGEGTVSPSSLSFTTDDWAAPQVVTVTGVHDMQTGNQPYTVLVGPAMSEDEAFKGALATVSITNIDNDSAGFFVTPTRLVTTEGGEAVFTVVLNKPPDKEVIISLTSSDTSIGTVAPPSLSFTAENWRAPQTVKVKGGDDTVSGGDRQFSIQVDALKSADESFAKLSPQTVSVVVQDNDKPGVMVALATGIDPSDTTRLRTSENGDLATFTVALNQPPEKDVTMTVQTMSTEGTVSPGSLTFTPTNWAAPQTVTVIGADNDNVQDGNQPYQVTLGPIKSDDPAYGVLTSADLPYVNVINVDNDKADVAVTLLSGVDPSDASQLLTTEKGASATFSVVLTSRPTAAVRFQVSSTNKDEGTISPTQLDFSTSNWNNAQVVTVTGANDAIKDGNVVYAVRISPPTTDDLDYQKLAVKDVKVVNLDDDSAGITPPKLLTGIDNGTKLFTTEPGGSATFSISLTSQPKADVIIPVTSSLEKEGKATPTTLTFTPANYSLPQTVTITGQNDSVQDGDQAYTVMVGPSKSDDSYYVGLSQSVKVTNRDDDSAYIVVTPDYNGTTTEKGGSATFHVSLHSQPTQNVTVTFKSTKESEGKVAPASLLFTANNWNTPQDVTVTGVNDDKADGDVAYTIEVKGTNNTDPNYMYAATTLSLVNKDDGDVASLKITAAANLQTSEAGGKATFTVALTSQPSADVPITVTSSNVKEGTVSTLQPFTANNWSAPQTVTVTGVNDAVADGNQTYTVSLKPGGADPQYAQLSASTVTIVNKEDDDAVGITVDPTSCATTPTSTATFSVVLKSQPLGPVSIALTSDTPTEGKIPVPTTLSFTPATWNVAQWVIVTGVDDGSMGMMTPYKIVTAAAVSAMDSAYNGLNAADVACVNTTPPPVVGP